MNTVEAFHEDSEDAASQAAVSSRPPLDLVPDHVKSREEWVQRLQIKRLRQPDEAIMQEAAEIDLLTYKDEIRLGKLIQEGSIEARNQMVVANIRLAAMFAQKFEGVGVDFEDLVQAGIKGLFRAAEGYNPDLGYRFSTYAGPAIHREMTSEIARMGRTISLSSEKYKLIGAALSVDSRLTQQEKRIITPEDIAPHIGVEHTDRKIRDITRDAADIRRVTTVGKGLFSLSNRIGDDPKNNTFQDMLVDKEEDIEEMALANIQSDLLARALEQLDDRERQLVNMIYGLSGQEPQSLRSISEVLGISEKAVKKSRDEALKKLRVAAEDEGLGV